MTIHKPGILDESSPDFHGNLVREHNWNLNVCQQCHGNDYAGSTSQSSCLTCHNEAAGPENCATCHGSRLSPAPPEDLNNNFSSAAPGVGAHQVHLILRSGKALSCSECHQVPGSLHSAGHIDTGLPAEVIMEGYLARLETNSPSTSTYSPALPLFTPDPTYDYSSFTCSGTYCHGNFKNGNVDNAAVWISEVQCGSCHGDTARMTIPEKALPLTIAEGGSHPDNLNCSVCHGGVISIDNKIINPSKHIDGLLNLYGNDIRF